MCITTQGEQCVATKVAFKLSDPEGTFERFKAITLSNGNGKGIPLKSQQKNQLPDCK
jgi:hypothetical protein